MYWRRLLCGEFTGPGLIARQITARFNCVNQSTDGLATVMVVMTDTYNNDEPNGDHYFVRGSSGWQRMSGDKDRTLGEKPGRVVIQITSSKTDSSHCPPKLRSEVFKIKRISAFSLNFNSFNVYCVKWMEHKLFSEKSPILVNYHISSYIIIQ